MTTIKIGNAHLGCVCLACLFARHHGIDRKDVPKMTIPSASDIVGFARDEVVETMATEHAHNPPIFTEKFVEEFFLSCKQHKHMTEELVTACALRVLSNLTLAQLKGASVVIH